MQWKKCVMTSKLFIGGNSQQTNEDRKGSRPVGMNRAIETSVAWCPEQGKQTEMVENYALFTGVMSNKTPNAPCCLRHA